MPGKKTPHKGKKAMRGRPLNLYDQPKKYTNLSLTPDAIAALDELAKKYNCPSRSELIERFARGTLPSEGQSSLKEDELEALAKKLATYLKESPG